VTAVVSFDREGEAPLGVGPRDPNPGPERRRRGRTGRSSASLRWCWLPAIFSLSVNAIFLVAWWLPEFGNFPGHQAVFAQLWPLASPELTSAGQPLVSAQVGRSGLLAALLLATSVALPFLVRSRRFVLRIVVPAAFVYVGVVAWVVTGLSLWARDAWSESWLGFLLLSGWVLAAGVTVWRVLWTPVEDLPPRPRHVWWVVALFAVLYPVPLALGRALFAADLTPAARNLLDTDPTLRIAALNDGSTIACYLSGLLLALTAWAAYMLVPPLQQIRVPWVQRRAATVDPLIGRVVILIVCVIVLVGTAMAAAESGRQRAEELRTGSPATDVLRCTSWAVTQPGQPTATLIARGLGCRQLTSYVGYDQTGQVELANSLTPVRAELPDGRRITSRVVSGQFGPMVVLAASTQIDAKADQLIGVDLTKAAQRWSFRCDDDGRMRLRFASADGADDAATGHLTETGEKPSVVVECTNQSVRLDPATGQPLR
jgi:hypothetical protein